MPDVGVNLRRKITHDERLVMAGATDATPSELAHEADELIMQALDLIYNSRATDRIARSRRALIRAHGKLMLLEHNVGGDKTA